MMTRLPRHDGQARGFFSGTRRQKWSLAGLNEYFGNLPAKARQADEVAGKKNKSATETGFLEVPIRTSVLLRHLSHPVGNAGF
jgi:hypothetical protein